MPRIGAQSRSLLRIIPLKLGLLKRKVYWRTLAIYRPTMPKVRRDLEEGAKRGRKRYDALRDRRS